MKNLFFSLVTLISINTGYSQSIAPIDLFFETPDPNGTLVENVKIINTKTFFAKEKKNKIKIGAPTTQYLGWKYEKYTKDKKPLILITPDETNFITNYSLGGNITKEIVKNEKQIFSTTLYQYSINNHITSTTFLDDNNKIITVDSNYYQNDLLDSTLTYNANQNIIYKKTNHYNTENKLDFSRYFDYKNNFSSYTAYTYTKNSSSITTTNSEKIEFTASFNQFKKLILYEEYNNGELSKEINITYTKANLIQEIIKKEYIDNKTILYSYSCNYGENNEILIKKNHT